MKTVGKSGFAFLLAATLFSAGALAQSGEDEAKTEKAGLSGEALKADCLKEAEGLDIIDQGEIKEYLQVCQAVRAEGGEVERAVEGG